MKIAFPVACLAFVLLSASAVQAEALRAGSLTPAARGQIATELMKKPVQTGTVISLNWYHMIDTPVYTMAALQPWTVAFDLDAQKPYARLEPISAINLGVSKHDTKSRTYFIDCVVRADKTGTMVTWYTTVSTSPGVHATEGTQAPQLVAGAWHISFVLDKPKAADFANLKFQATKGDFYVYQCDIAPVL